MRIALTGASGFTGDRLLSALREKGHHVSALVRPQSASEEIKGSGARIVAGDLRDAGTIEALVEARRGRRPRGRGVPNRRASRLLLPRRPRRRHRAVLDDLVTGFLLALERREAVGQAFILAGPHHVMRHSRARR